MKLKFVCVFVTSLLRKSWTDSAIFVSSVFEGFWQKQSGSGFSINPENRLSAIFKLFNTNYKNLLLKNAGNIKFMYKNRYGIKLVNMCFFFLMSD